MKLSRGLCSGLIVDDASVLTGKDEEVLGTPEVELDDVVIDTPTRVPSWHWFADQSVSFE